MILNVNPLGDVVLPAQMIQAPPDSAIETEGRGDEIILRLAHGLASKSVQLSIVDLPTIHRGPVDEGGRENAGL